MNIIINFDKLDLTKANKQGLDLLMDIALEEEEYLRAAKVRDEIKRRQLAKDLVLKLLTII